MISILTPHLLTDDTKLVFGGQQQFHLSRALGCRTFRDDVSKSFDQQQVISTPTLMTLVLQPNEHLVFCTHDMILSLYDKSTFKTNERNMEDKICQLLQNHQTVFLSSDQYNSQTNNERKKQVATLFKRSGDQATIIWMRPWSSSSSLPFYTSSSPIRYFDAQKLQFWEEIRSFDMDVGIKTWQLFWRLFPKGYSQTYDRSKWIMQKLEENRLATPRLHQSVSKEYWAEIITWHCLNRVVNEEEDKEDGEIIKYQCIHWAPEPPVLRRSTRLQKRNIEAKDCDDTDQEEKEPPRKKQKITT
jgi:hypothetical protein